METKADNSLFCLYKLCQIRYNKTIYERRWDGMDVSERMKYKLANAMKELLVHTPVDKITVKQIVDQCNVTRPTFYRHFPVLKEVKIKPYYGRFLLCLTLEEPDVAFDPSGSHVCAIDLGTDNFAAIVCDDHSSAIYKGGAVLSKIQWFHKQRAKYVSIITKGHEKKHAVSKRLRDLSFHYANFVKDQCHKISRSIIDFCMEHQCGTLILGVNLLWKQRSNMNKINNQNFVSMPITLLRTMLTYKALNAGIRIIEQEESYTSKADLIANDRIPTYGVDDKDASFSGKRIKRGLYRCSNGMILNADCHAAANIMRKAIPDIWKDTRDYTFLSAPDVYGFHKLNPKGIPVKGIAA